MPHQRSERRPIVPAHLKRLVALGPDRHAALTTPGGLARDLIAEARRRLAGFATLSALSTLGGFLVVFLSPATDREEANWLALPLIAVSAATALAAFRGWISRARVVDAAALHQIAQSVAIAAAWTAVPIVDPYVPRLSPIVVIVLLAPVIVPMSRARTLVVSLLCVLCEPIALLTWAGVGRVSMPDGWELLARFYPELIAVPIAMVVARVVQSLGERVTEARALGSYELVERIGQGGMGEVWRASNQRLTRDAAVKLIRDDLLVAGRGDPTSRERFLREARAVASLRSPHTVQVYDGGLTTDGILFFAMELLDGMNLEDLVQEHGVQPVERVIHILRHCAHSLREAHERGLVHRDIKPANLMVTRYGGDFDHVKVLDFGLVRDLHQRDDVVVTAKGSVPGTPAYTAPEITAGAPADARSDIYALGCAAYFLLTGELVFEGKNAAQMAVLHAVERPLAPSLRAGRPIPPAVDELVLRCLQKNPDRRPTTARALSAELADIDRALSPRWTQEKASAWWATRPAKRAAGSERPPRREASTAEGLAETRREVLRP